MERSKLDAGLLVERSKRRDPAAFEQLVQMYQSRVYGLCYQLTGNYTDSQDLAQEVFIKAYTSIKSFKQQADFGTWLHRITVNTWINDRRRQKRQPVFSLDAPVQTGEGEMTREMPSPEATPPEIAEQREFSRLIRRAMEELSAEHRAVLVLREIEGYSYEEIAQIMHCSLGTVRSRINRARKALREKITIINQQYNAHDDK